jgi:hypothetical protein
MSKLGGGHCVEGGKENEPCIPFHKEQEGHYAKGDITWIVWALGNQYRNNIKHF